MSNHFLKFSALYFIFSLYLFSQSEKSNDLEIPLNPETKNITSKKEKKSGEKKDEHHNEFKIEIASDFIRRGWALGTEDVSRRNNTPYIQFQPVWALQPTLEFKTPIKHLYAEVFFNLWLTNLSDKDNEQKVLQEESGGGELFPRYFSDLRSGNFCSDRTFITPAGFTQQSCYDPTTVKKYVNQNGMHRNHATEFTLFYDFDWTKYGRFKTGGFHYAVLPTYAPYENILSKTQIYTSYEPNFLRFLNPKISLYHTVNLPNQGNLATGLNRSLMYIPLELSHVFREGNFFRYTLGTSIGYMYQNNQIDRRSGFSDISSYLKFNFGDFGFTFNWVNRPDVQIYDNNYYFDGGPAVRYFHNGYVADPSKLYGLENTFIKSQIANAFHDPISRQIGFERYSQQKIVTNLFYFNFGYSIKF